mgnify:CR=1 FL=1
MAVFRIEKTRDYTVMSNHHLRDKSLSLKAKGLLSLMLSLPEEWDYTTKGLARICKDGVDSICAGVRELEEHGYVIRQRVRNPNGQLGAIEYTILEQPRPPEPEKPERENPVLDNPEQALPVLGEPEQENPAQLNTNQVITKQRNNNPNNYQSINLDGMDRMDEREQYRELIRDNLEIDIRSQDRHYDLDRVNEIVEIMLDAVCSTSPTIRINGEDMPQPVVKSRFLKLDSGHIDYVLQAMNDCPSDIRNIRAYLLTALYNASLTIDNYYSARVNYDFHGKG